MRSSSADIDIPVILLANEKPNLHVYMDNGTGKNRQVLSLPSCQLSHAQKEALLGLHAFSGNRLHFFFYAQRKESILTDSQEQWRILNFIRQFGDGKPSVSAMN